MKYFSLMFLAFWSIYFHLFSLFTLNLLWFGPNIGVFTLENETDYLIVKGCNWHGITCNPMHQRVIELNLRGYKLKGSISPHIGNLSCMRILRLSNNSFFGNIPQELGRLSHLQYLSVGNNSLVGKIPTNLTCCTHLKHLFLYGNNLIGRIPNEIGSLRRLQEMYVTRNQLTGGVPSFIGNLSSLTDLVVVENNLEGHIPQEICCLKSLTILLLDINKLAGAFPSCLYNMSSLTRMSAAENMLINGSLPHNMFHTLPNLQTLSISHNQFSGQFPFSITNASNLSKLNIGRNNFVGQIPSLGRLQDLQKLSLSWNNFGDNSINDLEFLNSLTNCSKLKVLSISYNNFSGHLPNSLGNLSTQLHQLYLGGNQFSGKIPAELGNLKNLILLTMDNSHFKGIIPSSFGKFQKLQVLSLSVNKLSGHIGAFIGNLSQLFFFNIEENMLEGNIPPSIGDCQMLQYLFLSGNNFKGIIPLEVLNLSTLINLTLSENLLSGRIPKEVGNLKNLNFLDISENRMFGDIPITIGECIMLEHLYLQGNSLHGIIPSSLASLRGLQRLDLSRNFLSGLIPKALENLYFLQYFNASFNMLDGEVPTEGVFRNASELVVTGNTKLCGGISELHLPLCPVKVKKLIAKPRKFKLIAVIVSVVAFILVLSIILTICWIRKRNKKPFLDSPTIDQLAKVSYQSLYNGTNGFSTTNMIGSGYFSSVYKGTLELEDKIVAIKVLNLQRKGAHKSFITECNALKNVKHRNLVQILTCCSSTGYKGQEFKALIFEYMRNGSLEQWLHPLTLGADRPMILNLDQRLNIMIDIASALHYLHHECEKLIIHSDLKPSNVLLDDDMTAHVSDFGIARLLLTINGTTSKHTSTIGIIGTLGYAPPEYGMGFEVSTCGDMYSFGILMLEMLTGKRPTDEMFQDGQNLCNFVAISFPDNLLQILDPHLIPTHEMIAFKGNDWNLNPNIEKCLVSLFRIGLACSMESPNERMNVVDVTRELNRIRKLFLVGVDT
ncbi:probable LRR receptor-like serine/threonine-protein kinase At3g47570 [Cajanus cajan]|uniref:probable LRR receptor-like serine/threonine-protein kinase At3g47570 n=1 Tax=Cajanus cajan TaxID=3821 RepID=UPI0010FB7353|nr:probable LRR receptor-like serine/threonine-protein kinase At3g47570 [Cajanus cajan]